MERGRVRASASAHELVLVARAVLARATLSACDTPDRRARTSSRRLDLTYVSQ